MSPLGCVGLRGSFGTGDSVVKDAHEVEQYNIVGARYIYGSAGVYILPGTARGMGGAGPIMPIYAL